MVMVARDMHYWKRVLKETEAHCGLKYWSTDDDDGMKFLQPATQGEFFYAMQ